MFKVVLSIILIFALIACKSSGECNDYLGQSYPDDTPEVFAPDIVSKKGKFEHGISFTPNIKEVVFGTLNDDFSGDIFYAKKTSDEWSSPTLFKPLKNESVYLLIFRLMESLCYMLKVGPI
ncbi:hypothetical protein ACFSQJ_03095 [Croceitalea marina]|uniref:Uncharacterized protein n=1 Tax=Croceitalea marina TaxID=1775166 RepID=A0ABW5MU96_9FLAO